MKKSLLICISVLLLCVLASCNMGYDADSDVSQGGKSLVKVSFEQTKTKAMSTSYGDMKLTYHLKAEPKFNHEKATVVGAVSDQVLTKDKDDKWVAGYFEQGRWDFTLTAVLSDGESDSEIVAQASLPNVLITPTNNTIPFVLTDVVSGESGNINFSIKVPRLSNAVAEGNYGIKLEVFVDTNATAAATFTTATLDADNDLLLVEGKAEGIDVGFHNIKLVYTVGTETICSQVVAVRVIDGAEATVTGSMLNGAYASGNITVEYPADTLTVSIKGNPESCYVKPGVTLALTGSINGTLNNATYKWYVDGKVAETEDVSADGKTYNFASSTQGVFSITCVVSNGTIMKSNSVYVEVSDLAPEVK